MTAPKRIQLSRAKGYRKPEGAVVVARPSKWGNPNVIRGRHVIDQHGHETYCAAGEQRGVAVRMFREDLTSGRLPITIEDVEQELRGRDLARWCPLPEPGQPDEVRKQLADEGLVPARQQTMRDRIDEAGPLPWFVGGLAVGMLVLIAIGLAVLGWT